MAISSHRSYSKRRDKSNGSAYRNKVQEIVQHFQVVGRVDVTTVLGDCRRAQDGATAVRDEEAVLVEFSIYTGTLPASIHICACDRSATRVSGHRSIQSFSRRVMHARRPMDTTEAHRKKNSARRPTTRKTESESFQV